MGGTGMGGNSAETLLPVNLHSNEGVGEHKFMIFYFVVVIWGKVNVTKKIIMYFFVFQDPRKREILLCNY